MVVVVQGDLECCRDKRQDVFISYSHHDAAWVEGELLPRLEHPDPAEHAKQVTLHTTRATWRL